MKKTITFLIMTILTGSVFGQTGLFKSKHYEFKNETDPSKNNLTKDTKILTLNFDAIENKYFIWREKDPDDEVNGNDIFYKWNIKSKIDANYDKSKNIVQTIYSAKWELSGVETKHEFYIYKIDDLNDKSLNIIIYNPISKTSYCFYNLIKI